MFAPPGSVAVNFQPLVSLAARRIIGFTAHSVRPRDEAMRAACRAAARWPNGIRLGIELSAALWRNPAIGLQVYSAIAESGLSPARLELEIAESALTGDLRPIQRAIEHLRQSGAMVALTGCRRRQTALPIACFDTVRFGAAVTQRLGLHAASDSIVDALIEAADREGVVTAADGIATQAQLDILTGKGCAEGQGSLFGTPVRGSEIAAILSYPSIAVA